MKVGDRVRVARINGPYQGISHELAGDSSPYYYEIGDAGEITSGPAVVEAFEAHGELRPITVVTVRLDYGCLFERTYGPHSSGGQWGMLVNVEDLMVEHCLFDVEDMP